MFENYENFQHFGLVNQHTARLIDQSARGYVFDLPHCAVPSRSFYTLIKEITDGEVWSRSTKKDLQSSKVVVLASCPPNLYALSLDQWQIFHPCLGLININCTQSAKLYYYFAAGCRSILFPLYFLIVENFWFFQLAANALTFQVPTGAQI